MSLRHHLGPWQLEQDLEEAKCRAPNKDKDIVPRGRRHLHSMGLLIFSITRIARGQTGHPSPILAFLLWGLFNRALHDGGRTRKDAG